ncbi:MAG: hypothetical protein WAM14_01770 [Candidatus Nitrosopolaris sp.]
MNGWAWKSRHLLVTAPVISKQGSTVKASLDIARDVYNPLLWSVSLQTENGMHAINVHQTEGAARNKILRMKGSTPMIPMKQRRD